MSRLADHLSPQPDGSLRIERAYLARSAGKAPLLDLCRSLVADGVDPATPLEMWRDDILCLRIRSIGQGAELTVQENDDTGPRFRRWASWGAAWVPAARKNASSRPPVDEIRHPVGRPTMPLFEAAMRLSQMLTSRLGA